jgi:peptidyl-prolyl cis-trans isomerase SurA
MIRKYSAVALAVLTCVFASPGQAQDQKIIATVNDRPVTTLDIDQQLKIQALLGGGQRGDGQRKAALNAVINEVVKIEEAKRFKMDPSDRDVDGRVAEIAKGLKTDSAGLEVKLRNQGIGLRALRQYVAAQISFARLLRFKYKDEVKVDDADIDRKFATVKSDINARLQKVMADPRMKAVNVYKMMEISFPVENPSDPDSGTLLQSRAIEANQYVSRFKGCDSARGAASGIFNVKVSKVIEADASRLPKPLKALLDSKGPGHVYGPMRAPTGIQLVAFCGKRTVTPPKPNVQYPTRQQIANAALSEKYDVVEGKYLSKMRKTAIIEYKDPAYAQ